uniref:Uncharacterized protein n=1 Tax=Leersia perrieri TaxID=77586 RepID=A0A0D9XXI3_9ORYZ
MPADLTGRGRGRRNRRGGGEHAQRSGGVVVGATAGVVVAADCPVLRRIESLRSVTAGVPARESESKMRGGAAPAKERIVAELFFFLIGLTCGAHTVWGRFCNSATSWGTSSGLIPKMCSFSAQPSRAACSVSHDFLPLEGLWPPSPSPSPSPSPTAAAPLWRRASFPPSLPSERRRWAPRRPGEEALPGPVAPLVAPDPAIPHPTILAHPPGDSPSLPTSKG